MIKRLLNAVFLMFFIITLAPCQSIDKPVATVKLIENDVISLSLFKSLVEKIETQYKRKLTFDEKKLLLNKLIDEKLILQAAKRDRIVVTESEVNTYIEKYRQAMENQLNKPVSLEDLRLIIEQSGQTWEYFKEEIKKTATAEKYVMQKKGEYLKQNMEPSLEEIEDYYFKNQSKFVSPEMVRFKQIFINTTILKTQADKDMAKRRAFTILQEIRNGASFDDYWEVFDESGQRKIGSLIPAVLRRDDPKSRELYGKDFFDTIFKMDKGEMSNVIYSKIGYHIVIIVEKMPFKALSLDDTIPPQNVMTVRNYIKAFLTNMKQAGLLQQALKDLVAELRAEADIKIWEENLNW